jgi:tetratricopeptide (TPR) repeat protein
VFVDALIAWLVAATGDRGLHLVVGSPDERKMRKALRLAIDAVVAQTPPDRRDKITRTLRDVFAAPPRLEIDLSRPLGEMLRHAVVAQLEPLAEYVAEDTGVAFYEDAGVDQDQFAGELAEAIDTAIRQVAATGGLAPLAARLDADYTRSRIADLGIAIGEQSGILGQALATHAADEAVGRLARLRERLGGLPAAARPGLEEALGENPAGAEQLVLAVTDPSARPAGIVEAWVRDPPAFLGTPDAPIQHGVWAAIGDIAAAYGLHLQAWTAFQLAVAAGSARRAYLLARAAWAALQVGDRASADSAAAAGRSSGSPEAALDVITALLGLTAESPSAGPGAGIAADSPQGAPAAQAPAAPADQQLLRDDLRRQLADWDPQHPADRDMKAQIGAHIELTDPAHSPAARYGAALRILDDALARGWLDDTALAAATVLRLRATTGTASDRSGDLRRAEQLALSVRDADRRARRDSTPAVRAAVAAAGEAGRYRQVIAIGSAEYGEATPQEAADPQVTEQVIVAAAQGVPRVADALAADLGRIPDGFVRAWAQALLAMRGGRGAGLGREDRIALWQQALAAATKDDERREALQGLAAAGADDLPGLDELLASDPATAAEWRARAALARGDPETAVSLAHLHRDSHASAASVLGEAYAALGQTGAAVDTLTTAASRFDHDDFIVQAAGICARAGDTARAEELLTDVLRTAAATWAGRGRARALLGELQADHGAWTDAIASWSSALEEDPHLESARWQLAYALAARGDHTQGWAVITADPGAPADTTIPGNPLRRTRRIWRWS